MGDVPLREVSLDRMVRAVEKVRDRLLRAVCSKLDARDTTEFAVSASTESGEGFFVLVQRNPYTPGGHTGYKVSNEFEVLDVMPGE